VFAHLAVVFGGCGSYKPAWLGSRQAGDRSGSGFLRLYVHFGFSRSASRSGCSVRRPFRPAARRNRMGVLIRRTAPPERLSGPLKDEMFQTALFLHSHTP